MEGVHGNYEYEKKEVTKAGEDFRVWEYRIKNVKTDKQFKYIIEIPKAMLNSKDLFLVYPIKQIVETEGEFLVKKWLQGDREERTRARVGKKGVSWFVAFWGKRG